jgi:phenylacetate-coenzyme A ligase PaaK-like adenylate-forming protein
MITTHMTYKSVDLLNKLGYRDYPLAYRNYALYRWTLSHLPNNIEERGLSLAWHAFERAQREVPAYRHFLAAQDFVAQQHGSLAEQFASIPATDKANYVRIFSTAERCVGGQIPIKQVAVDESSGATGLPYNWVRSQTEKEYTHRVCSYFHRYYFGDEPTFVINAFSMGAWATGMTMATALEANGIVKSTGPDVEKILATLRFFGPHHRYLITGYPPFLKHLLDAAEAQGFDWSGYRLMGMVGGEGMSESLRTYLLRRFERVMSGYGASDLEIGVAGESHLAIRLRQLMAERADVRHVLLGDEHRVPMLFQYNPLDHYIEATAEHELVITITRPILSPRIRYNIKDEGGVLSFAELRTRLHSVGVDVERLLPKGTPMTYLPFVYVFGRKDSTISYMGANIYPEDVEAGLLTSGCASRLGAFCLELVEDTQTGEVRPCVHIEVHEQPTEELAHMLAQAVRSKLSELSADFRQAVHEDQSANQLRVALHSTGQGPFAQNSTRIKRRYIVEH